VSFSISIKTSQTANTPAGLANGELAYSYSSDKLFIGQTDTANSAVSIEYIGGKLLVEKVANLEYAIAQLSGGDQDFRNLQVESIQLENAPNNAVLFAGANGYVDYAEGTIGRLLQIAANGMPVFDDLSGGTY
jgi:hypothetical protein